VSAHKELRAYLDAIAKQVGDSDVTDEVELRMAELLAERGVSGDKVVLPADIAYLKEQLGDPKDFTDDEEPTKPASKGNDRRLFRDPEHGMFAGVAAGLAAYFGVDVWLVRVLFVMATLAWGFGVPVYIVMWLLVPEAKTSSERLQMAGKPVTVDSLKEIVERADVKGAARRANDTLSGPAARVRDVVDTAFRLLVKIIGVGLTIAGILTLVVLAGIGVYLLAHGNVVADNLFPVGYKEHLLVYLTAFVAAMTAVFIILFGMAIFARKWPIRSWLTGVLVGLSIIALVGSGALAADIVPKVHDRYNARLHTTARQLKPFSSVNVYGKEAAVDFKTASTYSVSFKYFDHANTGAIKTKVTNGTLTVDAQNFDNERNCNDICIPDSYDMVVTVSSPVPPKINYPAGPDKPYAPRLPIVE
jgi:phage shock protein PspC (stress-responsive transcriptional regulator)